MRKDLLGIGLSMAAIVALSLWWSTPEEASDECLEDGTQVENVEASASFFGFDLEKVNVIHDTLQKGQFAADMLLPHIDYPEIEELLANSIETFDPRRLRVGRPYHIIQSKDSSAQAIAMIYEHDKVQYSLLNLKDSLYGVRKERPVESVERQAEGIIQSSLSATLSENGLPQLLSLEMADIFAWTIDFYRLDKGDRFKVIYEEESIDGETIGIGMVKACVFEHKGRQFKAYAFEQGGKVDYFDEEGEGLRKAFLKSPLKYGRLTSGFTMRRFHPVQRRYKAHLGTDYAAAHGTPILATGDGTVIKSSYTKNNGNYVKIRHNGTYTTQYLHMSKRLVKVGQQVSQGETIGLVGSTGLATGPHVCYRFWKNGKQVDHRQEDFPSTDPVLDSERSRFLATIRAYDEVLALESQVQLAGLNY